ncbi:hypothetical protein BC830DRAFT_1170900 [Chytriomyces sp. MP71]|nr:hypothetical protein BC830DRAFT_1170900 [Chytriomyces sp. MP71]
MQFVVLFTTAFATAVAAQDYSVYADATTTSTTPSAVYVAPTSSVGYVPHPQTYIPATQVTQLYSGAGPVSVAATVAATLEGLRNKISEINQMQFPVLAFIATAVAVAAQDTYVPQAQTYVAATQATQIYSGASSVSAAAAVAAVVAMML